MQLKEYIAKTKEKTFACEELSRVLDNPELPVLYDEIRRCEEEGLLLPIKSSGKNGNLRYPLYLKYKKPSQAKPDYTQVLRRIAALHPAMQQTGYLRNNPAVFLRNEEKLQRLNRTLFAHPEPQEPVSRKERSFAIFGEEKVLDSTAFCGLLEHLGLTAKELSFYDTPSCCFADYLPMRKSGMTLLICENKDIWFDLRRRMFEEARFVLLDTPLDGVVYGQGNRINEKNALAEYTRFLRVENVKYLYWGDIDREGFHIYLRLREANPELQLQLFTPGYAEMVRRAQGCAIPRSEDHREKHPERQRLRDELGEPLANAVWPYLEENRRLPQEILSYADLHSMMR